MNVSNPELLQIHYYLEENSHSMNALILNKAEDEILKIFDEISTTLGVQIVTETQALEEGGIKAIYKFLVKNKSREKAVVIGIFLANIAGTVISDVVSENIKTDAEFEQLKKEKITLEIEKLKNELAETNENYIYDENSQLIKDVSIYISEKNKVKISKSNFYKNIKKESKIQKVSTQRLNYQYQPISSEKIVSRQDFEDFIIDEASIEDDYQEQTTIEIVSPVLTENKSKWKAIYNDKDISFTLKDKNFKKMIASKNLSFSNGTKIICDLETRQKMNSEGDIIIGARSVYSVSAIIYSDGTKVDIIPK
ncbi:hypothetical protein ACFFVB_08510 [Formosa undariae]|uniref:Uncharacterized protein n=1 Tax=Formosa undariae TaxID=1325436 RepID=A0ABV5F121_9FLAO